MAFEYLENEYIFLEEKEIFLLRWRGKNGEGKGRKFFDKENEEKKNSKGKEGKYLIEPNIFMRRRVALDMDYCNTPGSYSSANPCFSLFEESALPRCAG